MQNKLRGTGVALVTPFSNNNEVDYPALEKLVDYVTANGINYLVVLGTTAETPTLSSKEKQDIASFIVKHNAGKLPIVVGIGGNNTNDLIGQMQNFDLTGVDAILSVTPYYNKPNQQGIYKHYEEVSKNSPLPIVLYNVPGRTGVNMTADTTLKLAHNFENIIAIKDAAGNVMQSSYILRDKPDGFSVISGDDCLALSQMALGFDGVISVAGNSFPKIMSRIIDLALQNEMAEAAKLHLNMIGLFDSLFAEGNPTGVKAALNILGIMENNLRLPLVSAGDGLYDSLKKQIKEIM